MRPHGTCGVSYAGTYLGSSLASAALVAVLVASLSTALGGQPERHRRRLRLLTVAALAAVAVKAAFGVAMLGHGWVLASRILALEVPLLAVPLSALIVALWSPARAAADTEPGPLPWRGVVEAALCVWAFASAVAVFVEGFFIRRPGALLILAGLAAVAGLLAWAGLSDRGRLGVIRRGAAATGGLAVALLVVSAVDSRLPASFDLAALARMDDGGGTRVSHAAGDRKGISVTSLTGPRDGAPAVSHRLVAQRVQVTSSSGRRQDALGFNGQVPGPTLRAREGDLIEVVLTNRDVPDGVSAHWHGYDVPNAEDGVAGVTQDAVPVGGSRTYRFLAKQVGTFWYHSHQSSSVQVNRGLYGALVVAPAEEKPHTIDLVVRDHGWRGPGGFLEGYEQYDRKDRVERTLVRPGTAVRLRLINTASTPQRYRLNGTSFRVAAIDGVDVNQPTEVRERALFVPGGGRYDVTFTMPTTPVGLAGLGEGTRLAFSPEPAVVARASTDWPDLDPASYGQAVDAAGPVAEVPDRAFTMDIDRRVGLLDGRPGYLWSVNGRVYPRMPMYMVAKGDLVRLTIINRSLDDHPIHLHGHHVQVLERNGRAVTGSPWSSDTLNAAPGERYVVQFRADNPGVWMAHCHNLEHAAQGFVMHLGYSGVTTPYLIGRKTVNDPE